MKHFPTALLLLISALLVACTPHPTSGVWITTAENDSGIEKLVVAFDGKAYFTTREQNNSDKNNKELKDIEWHCFWAATDDNTSELKCRPSNNTDLEEHYTLTADDKGNAQMLFESKVIASFIRQDEDPTLQK